MKVIFGYFEIIFKLSQSHLSLELCLWQCIIENGNGFGVLTFSPKFWTRPADFKVTIMPPKCLETVYMGQKLQDGKKVICVSLNSPHSERPPGQTAGPSNLPFWILGIHYRANSHKKFHLPETIFKGLKFKGKIIKTRAGSLAALLFCHTVIRSFWHSSLCLPGALHIVLSVWLTFWHPVDILNNFCFDN